MARWKSGVPSRAELRDAKRDAVLREASMSFNRRGFHGTSLDDVAQRLGVTKAALYYYFDNKQAVLKACFDLAMEEAFANLERAKREGGTGREKLRIVLAGFLEYIIDDLSVSVTMMEEDALSATDMVLVKAERDRFEHELRNLVREGIKDGSIVPCDPKLAVLTLLGALNWVPRWFKADGQWSTQELSVLMSDLLERMVSSQPAKVLDAGNGGAAARPPARGKLRATKK